jgi:hypothetical protein
LWKYIIVYRRIAAAHVVLIVFAMHGMAVATTLTRKKQRLNAAGHANDRNLIDILVCHAECMAGATNWSAFVR